MEEANHVPPERRRALLEIAETFNRLANEYASDKHTSSLCVPAAIQPEKPGQLSPDDDCTQD